MGKDYADELQSRPSSDGEITIEPRNNEPLAKQTADAIARAIERVREHALAIVLDHFRDLGDQDAACDFIERTLFFQDAPRCGIVLFVSDDVKEAWKRQLAQTGRPPARWWAELESMIEATQRAFVMAAEDAERVDDMQQAAHDAFLEAWHTALLQTALESAPFKVRFKTHDTLTAAGLPVFVFSMARGTRKV